MAKLTRSVTVDAPVEEVFDFGLDLARLWSSWPDVAVRDVDQKPEGVGSSLRMYGHFVGIHVEGTVEYTEVVRPRRIVATVGFGREHPTWAFTFDPVDGGTRLTAEGEWHVNVPGVGRPIEGLIAKEHEEALEAMLTKIKAQVEAGVAA
jgi:uncharacterized protein YndB with AHSA1/START domain